MSPSEQLLWKVYTGVVGTVTAVAVTKAITTVWKASTGTKPPAAHDLETPGTQAVLFTMVSAAALSGTGILVNRFAQRRFATTLGVRPK